MKLNFETFRYSLMGLVAALVFAALSAVFDWDLFERFVTLVHKGEAFEIDEIILPMALVLIGVAADASINTLHARSQNDKLKLYNHMSGELVDEISCHLTKLLEFRLSLIESTPSHHDIHRELDIIIVQSFKHFEHAQRRTDIDMSLLPLVADMNKVGKSAEPNNETVPPLI
ncbi:MAG: hypothetical protein WBK51_01600 [Polaromonas sp.]